MRQTISETRVRKLARAIAEWAKGHDADPWLVVSCKRIFRLAVYDASRLDRMAEACGELQGWAAELIGSIEKGDAAWIEIWKLARLPIDQRATRGVRRADKAAKARLWTLYHFREALRDGANPDFALSLIFPRIAEFHSGDSQFILDLAKVIRLRLKKPESFERRVEAWIRRAWLPAGTVATRT